jgi:hypothetical protein
MRWILRSPRRRRRFAIVGTLVLFAAPLIYVGVHYSTPGASTAPTGPNVTDTFYRQPKHVPFTPEKKREVRRVLASFIRTAVARNHVRESWDLAGPSLRQGFTRKEWSTGNIPIVPYPAASHGQGAWDAVQYSYPRKVGLEVIIFPKPRSGYSVATADVDVVQGHDGRWRIDYWMLKKFHGPAATGPADSTGALKEGPPNVKKLPGKKNAAKAHRPRPRPAAHPPAAAPPIDDTPRASRVWWALPLGLLALAVILPILIGTIAWIRNRRAVAAYHRSKN